MEDDEPTYGKDLRAIAFLLADTKIAVEEILSYIRGDDDEQEDEDDPDA